MRAPKTALVLSAGGMFGAYQAGVWKALSKCFRPDVVVGASIGSLNGWLIAAGMHPDALIDRWRRLDAAATLHWRLPRLLADGVVDCSAFEGWIREIFDRFRPRSDYGLVATALPDLRPRLFRWPELTWQHLASSCAIPLVLRHHRLNGVWHSDGGLLDPLPVWAAAEMGATKVIAVNVLAERPAIVRWFARAARHYGRYSPPEPNIQVVTIAPSRSLGGLRNSIRWNRDRAEAWVAQGFEDAMQSKHLVVECLEQQ